jgi:hypothetical protein
MKKKYFLEVKIGRRPEKFMQMFKKTLPRITITRTP